MPFIVAIAVCCVLPIMCVWLTVRAKTKAVDKKMEVLIKAIENGAEVDPAFFMDTEDPDKAKRKLTEKLTSGVMLTLMGLCFIVLAAVGFYSFGQWGYYAGIPLSCVGIANLVAFFFGLRFKAPEKQDGMPSDKNETL